MLIVDKLKKKYLQEIRVFVTEKPLKQNLY